MDYLELAKSELRKTKLIANTLVVASALLFVASIAFVVTQRICDSAGRCTVQQVCK